MGTLQKQVKNDSESGVPTGIRTPVVAVKGRCPRPLDDGDGHSKTNYHLSLSLGSTSTVVDKPTKRSKKPTGDNIKQNFAQLWTSAYIKPKPPTTPIIVTISPITKTIRPSKSILPTVGSSFTEGQCGGAKRDRTADLYTASVALSQLSYSPFRGSCAFCDKASQVSSTLRVIFHKINRPTNTFYTALLPDQIQGKL